MAPFAFNDGGRQNSKRPRQKNDCTVRAIAIVCAIAYDSAYDLLKAWQKVQPGYPPAPAVNEYRFDWIAFPATKGYLRMYPGDL
jgi:hypothetical protein